MSNFAELKFIKLVTAIVNYGMGKKIVKTARQHGLLGETITPAIGTVNNRILDFLGLSDIRKEIVYMMADAATAYEIADSLNEKYEFAKPNHGIAYITSVCSAAGSSRYNCNKTKEESDVKVMYHIVTAIVEKGKAELVIDASSNAGAKGGTIINGRGAGLHETSKIFMMDIEPEKEIVLILSEADKTEAIVSAISTALDIEKPGHGIVYVQDTCRTYGLYK